MKNKKINYILPDFTAYGRNQILLDLYDKYNFIFRENTKIYSFYGTFPRAIWNGGRLSLDENKVSRKTMIKVRDFYNKRGVVVTFTFTNALIKEEHLSDEYCNTIMEVFHNGMNEVLVVSPILEEYIRRKYPKYKINKSITFADKDNPYDTSKYHLSVIDKHLNRDFSHLKQIKETERIEILCDEVCFNDCKFTKQHYTEISEVQLFGIIKSSEKCYGNCRYANIIEDCIRLKYRNEKSNYYISPEDIFEKYAPLGFKYFKLSGRERYNMTGYHSVINYLIKPEYQIDVMTYVMEHTLAESKNCYLNLFKTNDKFFESKNREYGATHE